MSKKNYCRICKNLLSDKILCLKEMPLTDDFIHLNKKDRNEYLGDIEIYVCGNCKIIQNPNDFDHDSYYDDYQYSTGHSKFTQNFMSLYASELVKCYSKINGKSPETVLEVGSGDGHQLMKFEEHGLRKIIGIEPSSYLAEIANKNGIQTKVKLFENNLISEFDERFDICLSSYTFDHVRKPLDYIKSAYELLSKNGVLALEVHDLKKIIERTEYCLFEHEHTTYMNSDDLSFLLENNGFKVISINPIPQESVRGNSLIVIAQKLDEEIEFNFSRENITRNIDIEKLQDRINLTIGKIDNWLKNLDENETVVGFGAGGRGVMTIAALKNHKKISCLFDTNYESNEFLTPKTRIPIFGPNDWEKYNKKICIIFSFGYFNEISESLILKGFDKKKIISLSDFF